MTEERAMDIEDWAAENYTKRLSGVAADLRRLADTVEREGAPRQGDNRPGGAFPHVDYLAAAERVVNEVMWGAANLNLSSLVSAATQAHVNARKDTP